jgi:hypothetical protein
MADYTKSTNFATKDALLTGDPLKVVKGTELDDEFNAIENAIETKANIASPTLTGIPRAPTAAAGTATTQIATTAFVDDAVDTAVTTALSNITLSDWTIVDDGTCNLDFKHNGQTKFTMTCEGEFIATNELTAFGGTTCELSWSDLAGPCDAGQAEFTTPGSYTWTAPAGVTLVSVVAVGSGDGTASDSYFINTSTVCGRGSDGFTGGTYVGDGGGNGGNGSNTIDCSSWSYGDCGGAGGYSGNGGSAPANACSDSVGNPGSGGGGGSGGRSYNDYLSTGGGGVGIYGEGTSGAGGPAGQGGYGGSGGGDGASCYSTGCAGAFFGGDFGGGGATFGSGTSGGGTGGGGLGWKNNISVTPGTSYDVVVGANNGAVRIIWGTGRAFPSTLTADI